MKGSSLGQGRPDPQFTRYLDKLYPTLDELTEARELAAELISHPGWSVMTDLLGAEIASIDAELDSGRVLDSAAEYAAKHGRRGGLKAPITALSSLIQKADTRLEEQRRIHEGDGAAMAPERS